MNTALLHNGTPLKNSIPPLTGLHAALGHQAKRPRQFFRIATQRRNEQTCARFAVPATTMTSLRLPADEDLSELDS